MNTLAGMPVSAMILDFSTLKGSWKPGIEEKQKIVHEEKVASLLKQNSESDTIYSGWELKGKIKRVF